MVPVTKRAMERIIEFTELTANFTPVIPQPIRNKDSMLLNTTPSIAAFADSFQDPEDLCHMILLANVFDNQALLDVLSAKLALNLASMKVADIREFFGITNPFPKPEDEERILKENQEA